MTLPTVLIKDTLAHASGGSHPFGTQNDWSLWLGKQPVSPDRCITIYDSIGRAPNPKWLIDFPGIQIRVRGGQQDYKVAGDKAKEVQNRLVGRESYFAYDGLGDKVVSIVGIGDVAFTGWGENSRPEFVFNLALIVEPSPATPNTNREPLPG